MNRGAEICEAFSVASRIKDGDAASSQGEWFQLARRVEARGEASLAGGHKVSTRDQFHRADYYCRMSLISMLPTDPHFKERAQKSRSLVKKAGALFDPPLEYFEIPYEGTVLTGFSARPPWGRSRKRP